VANTEVNVTKLVELDFMSRKEDPVTGEEANINLPFLFLVSEVECVI